MPRILNTIGTVHGKLVHSRRVQRLAAGIAPLLEPGWSMLDVGCGDGSLAALIAQQVDDLKPRGLEIAPRPQTAIDVQAFDGRQIPMQDDSVDAVMMVDVLHHTDDPNVLLREAARVARNAVIIKDHRTSRPDARLTLRIMDWAGNRPHGVVLPYNYWSLAQWRDAWQRIGLEIDQYHTRLGLYPWPASWVFGCGLHILVKLIPRKPS